MPSKAVCRVVRRSRALFGNAARYLLCHSGCSAQLTKWHKSSAIVMYHGVESWLAGSFESQLQYLAKNFEVVPLDEILSRVLGNSRTSNGLVALTFDDGFRNNYTVAYPILRKLCLPATFFVCPGLIGRSRSIWTHEMRTRLKHLEPDDRKRFYHMAGVYDVEDTRRVVTWLKTIPVRSREQVEEEIHKLTPGFSFSEEEHERFDLMNWDELMALDRSLVAVGSHTLSHPDLTLIEPPRLQLELSASRKQLEERLGRAVYHLAYPFGAFNEAVQRSASKFYRSAVTVRCGGVGREDNPFGLKRIETDFDLPRFAWRLAWHMSLDHRC